MIDFSTARTIPLKLKHRNPGALLHRQFDPPFGTRVFQGGTFKSKTSNQGSKTNVKTIRPRRKAYGPFYSADPIVKA